MSTSAHRGNPWQSVWRMRKHGRALTPNHWWNRMSISSYIMSGNHRSTLGDIVLLTKRHHCYQQDLRTSVGKIVSERPLHLESWIWNARCKMQDSEHLSVTHCISPNQFIIYFSHLIDFDKNWHERKIRCSTVLNWCWELFARLWELQLGIFFWRLFLQALSSSPNPVHQTKSRKKTWHLKSSLGSI